MSASSQYYKVTSRVGVPHRHEVEVTVPLVGPVGPAGPAGTGLETLQVQGDTLYRGATTGERLPIGSAGQVLKVVNGLPAWANESGAVTSVNGRAGDVTVAEWGATPRVIVGATTINGGVTNDFQAPHTSYNVPLPTRFGPNQNGVTRVWVDRPNVTANLTLVLPTAPTTSPANGDIVEVYNLFQVSGYKLTINTQGFGTFDIYPRQSAFFAYSTNHGPARWVRTYDNSFLGAPPSSPGDITGQIGDMAFSSTHFYVKVPSGFAGEWRRVPWAIWT